MEVVVSGAVVIVEPWVPDDQVEREIVVVGRSLDGEGLVLLTDEPLGWQEWGLGFVLVVRPRHTGSSVFGVTSAVVNGVIWSSRWTDPLRFCADLTLEEPVERS
jgi:hypothetical protein